MAAFSQNFPGFRQFASGDAFEVFPLRFKVNAQPHAGEVEDGGDDGCFHHVQIGDADKFRHQKGCCPHHRRHELAAGGGRCFHGAGKFFVVAQFFHHGDGEAAGAGDVGHRAAGYRTHEAAGDDGHFRRAARRPAGHGVG